MCLVFHSNIQVENPVSVLDQEESKKFLTGKPGDKYAFFMKATELERIDMTYSSASDKIEELQDAQEKISRSIEKDQENMLQAKKRWEQHQALEKIQRKVAESRVKYAWAAYKAADSNHQIAVEVRLRWFVGLTELPLTLSSSSRKWRLSKARPRRSKRS